jgi:alanine or glycine:cation symporter, AGCS family
MHAPGERGVWIRRMAMIALATPMAAAAAGIDQTIEALVAPVTARVSQLVFYPLRIGDAELPLIVLWLMAAAIFCTFYFRFINLRGFVQGFRILRGDYSDPQAAGQVTHFQALTTAISGTVGLGNIAGVAIAVSIGGPGATFWMILAGLLGMSSKFCECTLGVMYRRENPDGSISGGPMYYISQAIPLRFPALAGFAKVLAAVFAVCCIAGAAGGGNMFQANQTFAQLVNVTGGESSWFADKAWLVGLAMAVMVGAVIIGGIRSIARVTNKLVPLMAAFYVGVSLTILFTNFDRIDDAFLAIWDGAFSPSGVQGGFLGVMIAGFRRATFSNEAGVGSSAIAHAAVRTREPVTEGLVALWEPFIDTVVICTMTALVIIITGFAHDPAGLSGVQLASKAYASVYSWFPILLAIAVFLFAFSTMVSWSYYGLKAATYLFGENRWVDVGYKLVYLLLTVVGCTMQLAAVTDLADALIFIMAVPNVIAIYLLAPLVKRELESYLARLHSGEIVNIREQAKVLDATA